MPDSSRSLPRPWFLGGAACLLLCVLSGSWASNLSFLSSSPLVYFSADDKKMMMDSVRAALDSSAADAGGSWSNPKTGSSGEVQVTGVFTTSDGVPCKQLKVTNRARGLNSVATYQVCKSKDRGWIANADAKPAS